MTGSLSGQLAVVTGANRGLGAAISIGLAAAGADVVLCARELLSMDDTAAAARAYGGQVVALQCDVTDILSTERVADQVLDRFGHVETVVANAGIPGPTRLMHEIDYQAWRECILTDLDGVFLTLRGFVPAMVKANNGSLIAISSITGKRPLAGRTPYAAAKMGVIGLMRTLAEELGVHGVRANTVCPGALRGPRMDSVFAGQAELLGITVAEAERQFTSEGAMRRLTDAEEVAAACVFLASPAASGITGQDLNVSAGLVMY